MSTWPAYRSASQDRSVSAGFEKEMYNDWMNEFYGSSFKSVTTLLIEHIFLPGGRTHSAHREKHHTACHSSVSYHHLAVQETLWVQWHFISSVSVHSEDSDLFLWISSTPFGDFFVVLAVSYSFRAWCRSYDALSLTLKKVRDFFSAVTCSGGEQMKYCAHCKSTDATFKFCVILEKFWEPM